MRFAGTKRSAVHRNFISMVVIVVTTIGDRQRIEWLVLIESIRPYSGC